MSKHTRAARKDNQTASEEQSRVAGVLNGQNVYDPDVTLLSGTEKQEFDNGETVHPNERRTQDTL